MSLIEMIRAGGAQLAPSLTFNADHYRTISQTTEVRGIAWHDGRLESIPLPHASTSTAGDSALLCLRAIASALLALYHIETTVAVLARVIPNCLINYDLDGERIESEGTFRFSVHQFVSAIAVEERSSTLKKELWARVDKGIGNLVPSLAETFTLDEVHEFDVPVVIGLLEWLLGPPSKRTISSYPTRSLTVWSLSIMLRHLGFDLFISPIVITSPDLYEEQIATENHFCEGKVFLVTCRQCKTDILAPNPGAQKTRPSSNPSRIVSISAIPTVIFRNFYSETEGNHLQTIWDDAFQQAYSVFCQLRLTKANVSLHKGKEARYHDPLQNTETESDTLLYHILSPQLGRYCPGTKWTSANFCLELQAMATANLFAFSAQELNEWLRFIAVTLATMYAGLSRSICSTPEGVTSHALTEVSVDRDLLLFAYKRMDLSKWLGILLCASTMGGTPFTTWSILISEIFTGLRWSPHLRGRSQHIFGFYNNGIFLVSDVLLSPSLRPESIVQFHTHFGQPLTNHSGQNGPRSSQR